MLLNEREITIPSMKANQGLIQYLSEMVLEQIDPHDQPVRFVITGMDDTDYRCELGVLSDSKDFRIQPQNSIFSFRKRSVEKVETFTAVLIIPTGIGAAIGGHSGDGGPVARLLASACDTLITHPNVVNASDINELPENGLYVEGSVVSRLLMGTVGLQRVRSNRVMLVVDKHRDSFFHEMAINSASAARAALGLDCPRVVIMNDRILMRSLYSRSGRAVGRIEYLENLCEVLDQYRPQYDAVALSSVIQVPSHFHEDYFKDDIDGMVNPWGGVEAMLTHTLSLLFDIPSAHSPMIESREFLNLEVGIVDPRKSAEAVSTTYLHCVLKGLHRSPRIVSDPLALGSPGLLTASDVSCLIIPYGCVGLPTLAALEQGMPVIAVRENSNHMNNVLEDLPFGPGQLIIVENYLEAAGVMVAIKAGVAPTSVRRPLPRTEVHEVRNRQELENGDLGLKSLLGQEGKV